MEGKRDGEDERRGRREGGKEGRRDREIEISRALTVLRHVIR